jgi:hypothetical protein
MEMANIAISVYDHYCISCSINCLSNFILMEIIQLFLVLLSGVLALRFLYKKYFAAHTDKGCGPDCGCH